MPYLPDDVQGSGMMPMPQSAGNNGSPGMGMDQQNLEILRALLNPTPTMQQSGLDGGQQASLGNQGGQGAETGTSPVGQMLNQGMEQGSSPVGQMLTGPTALNPMLATLPPMLQR